MKSKYSFQHLHLSCLLLIVPVLSCLHLWVLNNVSKIILLLFFVLNTHTPSCGIRGLHLYLLLLVCMLMLLITVSVSFYSLGHLKCLWSCSVALGSGTLTFTVGQWKQAACIGIDLVQKYCLPWGLWCHQHVHAQRIKNISLFCSTGQWISCFVFNPKCKTQQRPAFVYLWIFVW